MPTPKTVEFMRHFDWVPESNIKVKVREVFTVPYYRHGVEKPGDPKTSDEVVRSPLKQFNIPEEVLLAGQREIQTKRFTPEYLLNLEGLRVENQAVVVEANLVNYGVVPSTRAIAPLFPEEIIRPVLDQVAPIAVRGVLVSDEHGSIYFGRRANVDCSGRIETFPAGSVSEGENLTEALRKEAKEEAGMELGKDGEARLISLIRGRTIDTNPNFVYMIQTPWSIQKVEESLGKEHDKVYSIRLDEKILHDRLLNDFIVPTNNHDSMTETSIGGVLEVGRIVFGMN